MAITDSDTLNARGLLYIVGNNTTPFLSMIGGLNDGMRHASDEFALTVEAQTSTPAQNTLSEDASVAGVTADTFTKTQTTNVTQIMMRKAELSFKKGANTSKFTGVNNGQEGSNPDGLDFQKRMALLSMAKDIDFSFIQGTYAKANTSADNQSTRGLLEAVTTNVVNAGGANLSKALIDSELKAMWESGAIMENVIIFCGGSQKTRISDIYGYAPEDRNVGGINIKQIETDFGMIGVSLEPNMPASALMFTEMSVCTPVFNPLVFNEDIGTEINFEFGSDVLWVKSAPAGASFGGFYYSQIGLDYGPETYHGKITNLAV